MAARILGLEPNPAASRSASNVNLMSGLYCLASPAHGLSSHNRKESRRKTLCVCSMSVCLLLPGKRQCQEKQREQQAGRS